MSLVFATVPFADATQGGSIWVDNQESLLPGSSQNPQTEENHSGLGIVLVPELFVTWVNAK